MEQDNNLKRLIKYIREEDVVFFIGSGFSLKAGAPRVQQLIDAILQEGGEEFIQFLGESPRNLRNVSEAFVKYNDGRNELIEILNKEFAFTATDKSDHELLCKIPHIKQIFTTNYDTLLEDTYPADRRRVVTSNYGCAYPNDNLVTIYKIHGDLATLNAPDSIVITESDYKNYFKNKNFNLVWEQLQFAFQKKHVVFIGYSLEDDNILKIIDTVLKSLGSNLKSMFLVAPDIGIVKQKQLEKKHVAYINSVAEDVLQSILSDLKRNICDDVRHKKISYETFNSFCELNGNWNASIRPLNEENKIESVHGKDGCLLENKMSFNVDQSIHDLFKSDSFNEQFKLPGSNLSIPSHTIHSKDFRNFSYHINGIRFLGQEDIKTILIAPCTKKEQLTFKMKEIGFKETIDVIGYILNQKFHFKFNIPIGNCEMEFTLQNDNSVKCNTTINLTEYYSNSSDAIKWSNFILQVLLGKPYTIVIRNAKLSHFEHERDEAAITQYKLLKTYYEYIQFIENETDVDFETYENLSDENFKNAFLMYNYLKGFAFKERIVRNSEFSFHVDSRERPNDTEENFKKDIWNINTCLVGDTITINGKTFTLPFTKVLFPKCVFERFEKIDEYQSIVTMRIQEDFIYKKYINSEPQEADYIQFVDEIKKQPHMIDYIV